MAIYRDSYRLERHDDPTFDHIHRPSAVAPDAGIYMCTACGREIPVDQGATLPGPDHHGHAQNLAISWQLIVRADSRHWTAN